ncbi:MAG TPA: rubrerythrin family protein [Candidatus Lokiarchaeia archaeon]|nr:rubrerythrin family protein [Candidatus Lokiarchaeia archaeon]
MTKSEDDLKAAFAGESQANRKYLFFAAKATEEGFPQVAKLFRAAAEAETIHARNHFLTMNGVNGTADNLQSAMDGEKYEFTEMYPGFLSDAQEEENEGAQKTFGHALKVEETHYGLYSQAAESIGNGQDIEEKTIWVCPVCGQTYYGEAPEICEVCNCASSKFIEIQ